MKIKNYKYHILLVLSGVLWIYLLEFLLQLRLQNTICNDATNYAEAAQYFYQNQKTHYFRPSFLALLQGLPFLFGANEITDIYAFSYFLNVCCWIGYSIVFFTMLKNYFDQKSAFLIALCPLIFFGSIALLYQTLSENVYMFLVILAFYQLSKYLKNNHYFNLAIALSLFLLLILVRPGIMIFSFLIMAYFLKTMITHYNRKSNIFIAISLLLIFFHCIQMKKHYGTFTVSFIDSYTYYNYLGTRAEFLKTDIIFNQGSTARNQFMLQHSYSDFSSIAKKDFFNQFENNTLNFFKAYFYNVVENTKTGSTAIYDLKNVRNRNSFDSIKTIVAICSKWQNRIITLFGVLLSVHFARKFFMKQNILFYISLFTLYTVATAAISCCQGDRFHLVFFPLVVFLLVYYLKSNTKLPSEPLQK